MNGDIELEISPGTAPGEYAVRVVRAPAGGHPSGMFDLDVDAILNRLGDLEATVLSSAAVTRRRTSLAERPVREIGQQLFQALFSREVYGTYRASLGAAQQSGSQLRLILRLRAPQLTSLPWEMLFDPETESYLCQTEPLLRNIPTADYYSNPLQVVPLLRILGVISSPRGLPTLDIETERAHLSKALAGPIQAGRIELTWAPNATWDELHERLLAGPWHVLHFIGHGDYDTETDEGQIALVRSDGRANNIEASRFVDLLSTARPVPRLVVLNSCYSGRSGGQDLFSGTAAALARSGISAVAAMQFTVSDVGAVAFAHGFYAALANGRSVDEAARNGRISMRGTSGGTLEWVTPVLYVRGKSTELFALSVPSPISPARETTPSEKPSEPAPDPAEVPPRESHIDTLYSRARSELKSKHYIPAIRLLDELLSLEPGHHGAVFLRDTARRRYAAERRYRMAREAEDEQDWVTAAAGYELLASNPAFPDAATRQALCEMKRQHAALDMETRPRVDTPTRPTAKHDTAQLPVVQPKSVDADLSTRNSKAELLGPIPESPYHRRAPSPHQSRVPEEASAARISRQPTNTATVPGPTPSTPTPSMFFIGTVVLLSAGVIAASVVGFGTYGTRGVLRVLLGLVIPTGYILIIIAGLPDRTRLSRRLLIGAALSAAAGGEMFFVSALASAVAFCLAAIALVLVACHRASRRQIGHPFLAWTLLAILALHPMAMVLSSGGFLVIYPLVVTGVGVAFVVAARQLKSGATP